MTFLRVNFSPANGATRAKDGSKLQVLRSIRKNRRILNMSSKHQENLAVRKETSGDFIRKLARQAARQRTKANTPNDPEFERVMASSEEHKEKYGFYPWENDIPEDELERIVEEGANRFELEQVYIREFKKEHGITPDEWEHRQAMRVCPSYRRIVLQKAGIDSTRLFSIERVSRILKIGPKTVRNQLGEGTFPVKAHRIQGKIRFFAADLVGYLCEQREAFLHKPVGLAEREDQGLTESLERDRAKAGERSKIEQELQMRAKEGIDRAKSAQESFNNR